MKKVLINLLALILATALIYFIWNDLEELAYSGDGVFKAESGELGALLTNYSIELPKVSLNTSNLYKYKFKRFTSNNTTWLSIYIDGLTMQDIKKLPKISFIVRENGEVIFERSGELFFDSRYNREGRVWVGLKPFAKASLKTNWLSTYEIDLQVQKSPLLDKNLFLNLELRSGWK